MLRGVWQALNCLSIHATYCVIIAGASPGETIMLAALRENGGFLHLRTCGSNNWETVEDRWVHAARQFVSIELSFIHTTFSVMPRGVPRGNKKVVKIAIFWLTHWLKHRITWKLLKIDRHMLRGVWQALNCLSIHATYCVIVAGASPGETKLWAAVRENGDF